MDACYERSSSSDSLQFAKPKVGEMIFAMILRVSASMLQRCACANSESATCCHQPTTGFMWGACKTESDFAVGLLKFPLSLCDNISLRVPWGTPTMALPSAIALLLHATVSIIKAGRLGFLPDAPEGQVTSMKAIQHVTLITSLTGHAAISSSSKCAIMLVQDRLLHHINI